MSRTVGRWLAGTVVALASATLLAAAQSGQRASGSGQKATVAAPISVGQPDTLGAYRRPQSRAVALTAAECEGFGGKVATASANSCPATGKVCYTANADGVIHQSCITAQ